MALPTIRSRLRRCSARGCGHHFFDTSSRVRLWPERAIDRAGVSRRDRDRVVIATKRDHDLERQARISARMPSCAPANRVLHGCRATAVDLLPASTSGLGDDRARGRDCNIGRARAPRERRAPGVSLCAHPRTHSRRSVGERWRCK